MSAGSASPDIVENRFLINVSGVKFQLLKSKICIKISEECTNCELLPSLSTLTEGEVLNFADGFNPTTGEYYFNRSPDLFRSIADYYHTGQLHKPPNTCYQQFLNELEFWQISSDHISPCCSMRTQKTNEHSAHSTEPTDETIEDLVGQKLHSKEYDEFSGIWFESQRRVIWNILEKPNSSHVAKVFSCVSVLFVSTSIIGIIMSSMEKFQVGNDQPHQVLVITELSCIIWFTFEYFFRLIVYPNRWKYLKAPLNIIDALSVLPFYVDILVSAAGFESGDFEKFQAVLMMLRILRVLRIMRVFKLARYSKKLMCFIYTFWASSSEFSMLFMYMSICVLLFSTTVYYLEKDVENTKFKDIPISFWWCIVTITTVGYGDLIPETLGGRIVSSFAMISGVIILAFPITLIISNFNRFYSESVEEQTSTNPGCLDSSVYVNLKNADSALRQAVESISAAHVQYTEAVEELKKQLEQKSFHCTSQDGTNGMRPKYDMAKRQDRRNSVLTFQPPAVSIHHTRKSVLILPKAGLFSFASPRMKKRVQKK